jgi:hypothetical protein
VRIADLNSELPNGFHDAVLVSIMANPEQGTLEFALELSVEETSAVRERYRPAGLLLTGVTSVSIDPPGDGHTIWGSRRSMIDLCDADPAATPPLAAPPGGFAARFFVVDWNAFIHFAAMDASLTWDGV